MQVRDLLLAHVTKDGNSKLKHHVSIILSQFVCWRQNNGIWSKKSAETFEKEDMKPARVKWAGKQVFFF